ncbi:ATP-binding protein [Actinocorallia populi]|uniref:ATP-binding protein n=1 Tax=Actinocorallia populi TaxID=2079200 RepID=UPI000D0871B6|nr:ATP-binding protein [Actinocorallia populi]
MNRTPAVDSQVGPSTSPGWTAERTLPVDLRAGTAARDWLRGIFGSSCRVRDEFLLVVSELLGNCAEHGGDGKVSLSVVHGRNRVWGRLVHHSPPIGKPVLRGDVTAQTELLLAAAGPAVPVEDLAEDGRGLFVVQMLCAEYEHVSGPGSSVTEWAMADCGCFR